MDGLLFQLALDANLATSQIGEAAIQYSLNEFTHLGRNGKSTDTRTLCDLKPFLVPGNTLAGAGLGE